MAYYDTPMTKLEAVNICLKSIGEPQVDSLAAVDLDVQVASDLVDEVSRTVLNKGWNWNTRVVTLTPDNNGHILLPANTAKIDTAETDYYTNAVQRGTKLFDLKNGTYVFTKSMKLEIVELLPFEDVPLSAKCFIAYQAAMMMQQRYLGSDGVDKNLKEKTKEAWNDMLRDDLKSGDNNMLSDSWSSGRIINRTGFRRNGY